MAQHGSLRRAAEELHVSASAIDRQILLAERTLGTELFERNSNGLKLTAAGEMLAADLRRWRREFSRTAEQIEELRGLRRGQVSLAIIDALSEGFVPRVVAALGAEYPRLHFDLTVRKSAEVAAAVRSMEADFGMLLETGEETGLDIIARAEVPVGVVVPNAHPWARETSIRLSALHGERQILAAAPLMIAALVQTLSSRGGLRLAPALRCNDVRMVRALIRAGAGVGILTWLDAAPGVDDHGLVFLPLETRQMRPLSLVLCVAPRRQLSRAASMAVARMAEAIAEAAAGW